MVSRYFFYGINIIIFFASLSNLLFLKTILYTTLLFHIFYALYTSKDNINSSN